MIPVPFADLKGQYSSIRDEIDRAVSSVIQDAAFIGGSYLEKFEEQFAAFCGVDNCVGVGNGTDALVITLKCLDIGSGDEVVVPANSFIATSEAVTLTGASVVFCDVDPATYTIDAELLKSRITDRTKAVIPVHLYGQPSNMNEVMAVARERGLRVIEDAAQAHGAKYMGKKVGALGDAACFSFYPGKNLGAYGDAGAIVTSNSDLAERVRMFRNHGRKRKYGHEFEGTNSRLDGLQAAILSVKLKHLPAWTSLRQERARLYTRMLEELEGITCPHIATDRTHVFHLFVIRTPYRDELRKHLTTNGIATGIHYPVALPNLEAYRYLGHGQNDFPVASRLSGQILSLPIYAEMTEGHVEQAAAEIRRFSCSRPDG